jgi:hypothetical protein
MPLSRPPRWIERTFPAHLPIAMAPNVWTRIAGSIPRIQWHGDHAGGASEPADAWSMAEHIGHLGDLEVLAHVRLDDFDAGRDTLHAADMSNTATKDANYRSQYIDDVVRRFIELRAITLERTARMSSAEWGRSALHPRLKTPMRVIDLMEFMAEHDDHHFAEMAFLLGAGGRRPF